MSNSVALIVNPNAGRLSGKTRDEVVDLVRRRLDAEIFYTAARDAGASFAREAVEAGAEVVVAFGGDGHVNEVVNGIQGSGARLGIIPGGTMNVFARALNIPLDPMKAVDRLRLALSDPGRKVPLGRMDDRLFTFSAGCGFDAETAERVERDIPAKRRFGELFFYWSAFRVLAGSYRHRNPTMILRGPFGEVPVAMAIASNAGPYAYLMNRPIAIAPHVKLDAGMDVFALTTMRFEAFPLYAWRCAVSGDLVHHRDAFYVHDVDSFEIVSETPFKRHVDGEPLPAATSARFSLERDTLRVIA